MTIREGQSIKCKRTFIHKGEEVRSGMEGFVTKVGPGFVDVLFLGGPIRHSQKDFDLNWELSNGFF